MSLHAKSNLTEGAEWAAYGVDVEGEGKLQKREVLVVLVVGSRLSFEPKRDQV